MTQDQVNSIHCPAVHWSHFDKMFIDADIHVFRVFISNHLDRLPAYHSLLNADEISKASRFFKRSDQERFIVCKGILKQLLGLYLRCPPDSILFKTDLDKKPVLKDFNDLHFNISHSKNCAAIAISRVSVGIDIEHVNIDFNYAAIAEACFTPNEIDFLEKSAIPIKDFFKLWTRKEAFLKATGKGLTNEMNKLNCLEAICPNNDSPAGNNSYRISSFEINDTYTAALAYQYTEKETIFYNI